MAVFSEIALVPIDGDLDVRTVAAVRSELEALVDAGTRRIILNMAGASYIDSAGMGLIISLARRMRRRGGLLSLINVSDQINHALSIACVADMIPVASSELRPSIPVLDPSVRPVWVKTLRMHNDELQASRHWVANVLSSLPLSQTELFDMTLASGEALGNAVDHACAEGTLVRVARYADRVVVEVADCGQGCNAALSDDIAHAATHATNAEGGTVSSQVASEYEQAASERGRGIKLMRLLADSVSISPREQGTGTLVQLVKMLWS